MTDALTYEIVDEVAVITITSPPVNALGLKVRIALQDGFERAWADPAARAIVLTFGGATFCAGADITEFAMQADQPNLAKLPGPDMFALWPRIEASDKPVVAAIHGTALGGGYELALHCHYRIAVPSAKVGLPEVGLGLLPAGGGTQRLPRIVGVPVALDLITSGKQVPAPKALELGMIDRLAGESSLRADAINYARELADTGAPLPRLSQIDDKVLPYRGKGEVFAEFAKANARSFRGFKAPGHIIKAVQAAADLPYTEGIKREMALFLELVMSPESMAQQYVFFAQRETVKVPDVPADTPGRPVRKVGVIGAGTMGGGIAMNYLQMGVPVVLVEMKQEALDRGIAVIRRNFEGGIAKGRTTQEKVDQLVGLIQPSLTYDALTDCDLVTEAVFEQMSVKKEVFARLDAVMKPGAILATNTSFLDVDEIATATKRPADVIGHHYFSPANVMPLLEIVRGAKTAKDVIATSMALARQLRKTPVLARVCEGFIANRLMRPYTLQASAMALEGVPIARVDKVAFDYGFAVGPFAMFDIIGLDVLGRDSNGKTIESELVDRDRLGQKKNGGFYDYDEKRRITGVSPVANEVVTALAKERGVTQTPEMDDTNILARLLYPVINMGARILDEKIAIRASDIDIAAIMGYNWPVYRGGPMHWAGHVGLDHILARLKEFAASGVEGDFTPSPLLERLAESGQDFSAFRPQREPA